jgi:cytoplasmic iron level regulating protein YaaA (DUF328/UPF0246 family)
LSGLYGILKPLDSIKPYRLDIASKLENHQGKTLYPFWRDKISKALEMYARSSDLILNLASEEYAKGVDWKRLNKPVLNVSFLTEKNGVRKVISYDAKVARGTMTRMIIKNRISNPDQLQDLWINSYKFDKASSSRDHFVYIKR